MSEPATEQSSQFAHHLDELDPANILAIMHEGQVNAARAVEQSFTAIEKAARLMGQLIGAGGNLIYAAAGSSGLMAMADALELPGTFGIEPDRIKILLAGGAQSLLRLEGGVEDDEDLARTDIRNSGSGVGDCLICLSASGTTPYALAAIEAASQLGIKTIAITNNPNTELAELADVDIYLPTPPEVISGSTRLGAGTAQKICLNMMSTLMAIELGHVHDGLMVNLMVENTKLRDRAARMINDITDCGIEPAAELLDRANGSVKVAVLLASGAGNIDQAKKLLESNGQKLRASLSNLSGA